MSSATAAGARTLQERRDSLCIREKQYCSQEIARLQGGEGIIDLLKRCQSLRNKRVEVKFALQCPLGKKGEVLCRPASAVDTAPDILLAAHEAARSKGELRITGSCAYQYQHA